MLELNSNSLYNMKVKLSGLFRLQSLMTVEYSHKGYEEMTLKLIKQK